jgi:hypothetical protein
MTLVELKPGKGARAVVHTLGLRNRRAR